MFKFDNNDPAIVKKIRIAMCLVVLVIVGQYVYVFFDARYDLLNASKLKTEVSLLSQAKIDQNAGRYSEARDAYSNVIIKEMKMSTPNKQVLIIALAENVMLDIQTARIPMAKLMFGELVTLSRLPKISSNEVLLILNYANEIYGELKKVTEPDFAYEVLDFRLEVANKNFDPQSSIRIAITESNKEEKKILDAQRVD